jgi:hypothetical protein
MRRRDAIGCLPAIGYFAVAGLHAQSVDSFSVYLDWVPISGSERADVAGRGSATATLARLRLSITGRFEGMIAPATRASLHHGVVTGVHGPQIAELEISRSTSGTFEGEVELTRDQRDALFAGRLYLQLDGERGVPPDNAVLWGWLLADRDAGR